MYSESQLYPHKEQTISEKDQENNKGTFAGAIKRVQYLYNINKNVCISVAILGPGTKGAQQ